MTQVNSSINSVVPTPFSTHKGAIATYVNGSLVGSASRSSCLQGTITQNNSGQPNSVHAIWKFTINGIGTCQSTTQRCLARITDNSGVTLIQKTLDVTSNGTYEIHLDYNYDHVGIPEGAPTYLETLDKLDQWSSAQYIPSRNELNL